MCSPILALAYGAYAKIQQSSAQAAAETQQGQNEQRVDNYNASIENNNAIIQARAATDAESRGANDAGNVVQKTQQQDAEGRAQQGSSGFLADTGSNLNLVSQNAGTGEENALTVMNNAEREAYGYKIGQSDALAKADVDRLSGKTAVANAAYQSAVTRQSGLLDAGSTLITGAANYGKLGGFGSSSYYPATNTLIRWNTGGT